MFFDFRTLLQLSYNSYTITRRMAYRTSSAWQNSENITGPKSENRLYQAMRIEEILTFPFCLRTQAKVVELRRTENVRGKNVSFIVQTINGRFW